ncbi:MAG TPA: PQQ-binding-like beta-propeller repeat protein [Arachnia sp.]|nr:PQQ-binding-like beta-propeller repeat protein [Arachnia sp.]HMT86787.1 PQQ-binding-like beta-propeller repeat protein [Arachnia sp.]
MGSQAIDDDRLVPERIGGAAAPGAHVATRAPRNRAPIVVGLVVTVALLLGGALGYDAWRSRGGDGYLADIPSAPEIAWSISLEGGAASLARAVELGDDALLLEGGGRARLISLDDGEEIWTRELLEGMDTQGGGSVRFASPDGEVLGSASGPRLVTLNPATGETAHDVLLGSSDDAIQDVAARDGVLYVGLTRDRSRTLLALDADRPGEEPIWMRSGAPDEQAGPVIPDLSSLDPEIGAVFDRVCATADVVIHGPESWLGMSGFGLSQAGGLGMRNACWIDQESPHVVHLDEGNNIQVGSEDVGTTVVIVGGGGDGSPAPWPVQVVDPGTGQAVPWMDPQDAETRYLAGDGQILRFRPGGNLGVLMLLDADGTERWPEEVDGSEAAVGPWGVAVRGYGELDFLDLDTGEERWSVPRLVHVMAATRLGPVLASSGTEFAWYDATTGKELFATKTDEPEEYVDAVIGESRRQVLLHVSAVDGSGSAVRAYDAQGRQVWEHPVPDGAIVLAYGEALLQSDGLTLSRLR